MVGNAHVDKGIKLAWDWKVVKAQMTVIQAEWEAIEQKQIEIRTMQAALQQERRNHWRRDSLLAEN